MPQALTNTNISATYKGVLHCNGTTIPTEAQEIVYDGVGVQSSLRVGRDKQGATVSGALSATNVIAGELRMPSTSGTLNQVVTLTTVKNGNTPGVLGLRSLSDLIAGATLADGVYSNPQITVQGGVITKIESKPTVYVYSTPITVAALPRSPVQSIIGPAENTTYYPSEAFLPGVGLWSARQINWAAFDEARAADARYVIIKAVLLAQSSSTDYRTICTIDGNVIVSTEVREDPQLSVDTVVNTTQQIIALPNNKISSLSLGYVRLNGNTFNGLAAQNSTQFSLTLDGWIY